MEEREEAHASGEPPRRSQSLFQSFNYAAEGIIHAVRTQRNLGSTSRSQSLYSSRRSASARASSSSRAPSRDHLRARWRSS